jgi:hypothetical protein
MRRLMPEYLEGYLTSAAARGTEMRRWLWAKNTARWHCRSPGRQPPAPKARSAYRSVPSRFVRRPDIARRSVRSAIACFAMSFDDRLDARLDVRLDAHRTDEIPHAQCPSAAIGAAEARATHVGRSGGFSRQAGHGKAIGTGYLNTELTDFACGGGRNVKIELFPNAEPAAARGFPDRQALLRGQAAALHIVYFINYRIYLCQPSIQKPS